MQQTCTLYYSRLYSCFAHFNDGLPAWLKTEIPSQSSYHSSEPRGSRCGSSTHWAHGVKEQAGIGKYMYLSPWWVHKSLSFSKKLGSACYWKNGKYSKVRVVKKSRFDQCSLQNFINMSHDFQSENFPIQSTVLVGWHHRNISRNISGNN